MAAGRQETARTSVRKTDGLLNALASFQTLLIKMHSAGHSAIDACVYTFFALNCSDCRRVEGQRLQAMGVKLNSGDLS